MHAATYSRNQYMDTYICMYICTKNTRRTRLQPFHNRFSTTLNYNACATPLLSSRDTQRNSTKLPEPFLTGNLSRPLTGLHVLQKISLFVVVRWPTTVSLSFLTRRLFLSLLPAKLAWCDDNIHRRILFRLTSVRVLCCWKDIPRAHRVNALTEFAIKC